MRRHRTTARGILVTLLLAGLAAPSVLASGASGEAAARKVPRLVFPLVAKTDLWDNYGDPRPNGRHAGIDLENPWRAPVVAVEAGRVSHATSRLGGCMLYLHGRSGTTYLYVHLNNDRTPRNDNQGGCVEGVAFAVPDGARVTAGEQVGWNGDSGDAAGNPHLHFEVHPGGGADVNPFPHLRRAQRPLFAARVGATFSLGLRGSVMSLDDAALVLRVQRVRHYPGGRWLEVEPREVELALPPATLASGAGAGLPGAADVRADASVVAHTAKAKVTPKAIVGAPGSLVAHRVAPTR